jgi:hypothetical protein
MERVELRRARRYRLSLPVAFHSPFVRECGKTRDISSCGVYFVADEDPGRGAVLQLTVAICADLTGGPEVFVYLEGTVVRVDRCMDGCPQRFGIATTIETYEMFHR